MIISGGGWGTTAKPLQSNRSIPDWGKLSDTTSFASSFQIRKLTRENKGLKEQIKAIGGLTDNSIDPVDVNANVW